MDTLGCTRPILNRGNGGEAISKPGRFVVLDTSPRSSVLSATVTSKHNKKFIANTAFKTPKNNKTTLKPYHENGVSYISRST